jgi:hypothetical protein
MPKKKSKKSSPYKKINGKYYTPMAFVETKEKAKRYAKRIRAEHKDMEDPLHKSVRIVELPKTSKRRKKGLKYGVWIGSYHSKRAILKDHPEFKEII